jgi:hypothetical protein
VEIVFLRKQIEILQRINPKLKINKSDRLLFSIMKDILVNWKEKIFIVKPETVIKWQNGYVERVIGSIKRECLDNIIVMNDDHLRNILNDYVSYYNKYRTHLGIKKDSPEGRAVQIAGKIDKIPAVNGLHHVYFRQAA